MITKCYIIATEDSRCYGHGDYGTVYVMEQENAYHSIGTFPPVFMVKEDAEKYLSELTWITKRKCVMEVELRGESKHD